MFILFSACTTTGQSKPDKWYQLRMMSDPILDEVLLYYLGNVWQGSADINECLETVGRIDRNNPASWSQEWKKTAERLESAAIELLEKDHNC